MSGYNIKSVANERIYSASLRTGKASVINSGKDNSRLFFILLQLYYFKREIVKFMVLVYIGSN